MKKARRLGTNEEAVKSLSNRGQAFGERRHAAFGRGSAGWAQPFTCDTCEQIIAIDEAVTSPVLPSSRFCSTGCRDEAELAAENARYL